MSRKKENYSRMLVADLKALCKENGLPVTGRKADLVERLEELDGQPQKKKIRVAKRRNKAPVVEEDSSSESEEEEEAPKRKPVSTKKSGRTPPTDPTCNVGGAVVVEDYDCMLNQTNIAQNNNKFYVIQLLVSGGSYYLFTRWGRVGETGRNSAKPQRSKDAGIAAFKKQFKAKTGNDWDNRADFVPKARKYTLIEMDHGDDEEEEEEIKQHVEAQMKRKIKRLPCSLPKETQALVKLIFDHDMFNNAMKEMEIDTKKLPLGKISTTQIERGFEVLEDIEQVLNGNSNASLVDLTSRFYTEIPHAFGRRKPPVIRDMEHLQQKKDMLNVLGDIEIAQELEKLAKEGEKGSGEVPHIMDINYGQLKADVTPLDKNSDTYQILERYLEATKGGYNDLEIVDIFEVGRHGEEKRFAEHAHITNRKLLWHGTNVAVVVAILSGGLRIMPHSGGRVGRGIYFASENAKSAAYVRRAGDIGIMFLSEVALGKEHHINRDDCSLTRAPPGYDCIIAKGHTEPDPAQDTTIEIEGNEVVVPQGEPKRMPEWQNSSFSHSEYLIYKESQNRIRYLLKIRW
eukprot:CAMPEP_0174260434 /NCGR_PEP_ID=MMETSP0439-20130205/9708_1 /TAXON_ID=0 /ORGANISM="Stereomyxa ramosa, Strain Chinc5" /LENGTH=570 /DNA_ID=CAMNT_0015344681 /DNA_START=41 /DNA_END=1750 /DNA_ORIENTATION=+